MRGVGAWLKRVVKFIGVNGDACLAISIAVGVIVAQVVGDPSVELIDATILALLGTIAVALLRDRGRRSSFESLAKLAEDAISARSYDVVWQNTHWDLHDRQKVTVKKTEQIRFTRNDVCAIVEWRQGDGIVEKDVAKWRRNSGSAWLPAKLVHQFSDQGGTKGVYCFNEEHQHGDQIDWCTELQAVGRFSDDDEKISVEARTKSDYPRIVRITWPTDQPPSRLELRRGNLPVRQLAWQLRDGRPHVEETIASMAIGEVVTIYWSW